jgi:CheY-like chemotaxis protein
MKNILVIDDKDDLRSSIVATLVEAGFATQEAKNGRMGILKVLAHRPDLIICDVNMPEMDGYRTLEAIRKVPGTAAIPFIIMTGSVGVNGFRQAMDCGADDFVMKPFTPNQLLAAVKSRLARQTHFETEARILRPATLPFLVKDAAPLNRHVMAGALAS